eukprot:7594720-Karenia_brevis.AAC.1
MAALLGGSPGTSDDILAWLLARARWARGWARGNGQWGDYWYRKALKWYEHCKWQHHIASPASILLRYKDDN